MERVPVMKTLKTILAVTLLLSIAALARADADNYSAYYEFTGWPSSGNHPYGNLTLSADGTLYGVTEKGGANNKGFIFEFDPATSTVTPLHSFALNESEGYWPQGSLTLVGGMLYGMAYQGGTSLERGGTIFKIDPDNPATSFEVIHPFPDPGVWADGQQPGYGSLTYAGGLLYGTTVSGGASGVGTVFSIDPVTSAYSVVYPFNYYAADEGSRPWGSLTASADGTLYGMTQMGGNGVGTIFEIDPALPEDERLTAIHRLPADKSEGAYPYGSLTFSGDGNTLYGMTANGGTGAGDGNGMIFACDPDTLAVTPLYTFDGYPTEGAHPYGDLTLGADGMLYGMTYDGGIQTGESPAPYGTIFKFDPVTLTMTVLNTFYNWTEGDGANPYGSLTLSADGKTLYGMTSAGGTTDGYGTIFGYEVGGADVPEPSTLLLLLPFIRFGLKRMRAKKMIS